MIIRSVEAALGLYVLIAQAASAPTVDISKTCRASEKALLDIFGSQTVATFENCMRQEEDARQQMIKNWTQYATTDRQRCVNTAGYMPSYVEWLTCFEMQVDVRKLRKDAPNELTPSQAMPPAPR